MIQPNPEIAVVCDENNKSILVLEKDKAENRARRDRGNRYTEDAKNDP